jgi:cell shape-determining protein MreC
MTTISSNRRRKKISGKTAAFLIFITILLSAALLWRDAAASLAWRAVAPLLEAREGAAVGQTGFFAWFDNGVKLAAENAALKQALASTTALLLDRNFLYQENLDLKHRLGRTVEGSVVLGTVIMRPPTVPYGILMIDIGRNERLQKDDLVAAAGSVYIGRVTEVFDTTARVTLFSAPGQTHEALLRGSRLRARGAGLSAESSR